MEINSEFSNYFIRELINVDFFISQLDIGFKLKESAPHYLVFDKTNYAELNEILKSKTYTEYQLKEVKLRNFISEQNDSISDSKFKTFLNSLLLELIESSNFYNKNILDEKLEKHQKIVISTGRAFNDKIFEYLFTYYNPIFPDLFTNHNNLEAKSNEIWEDIFKNEDYFISFKNYMDAGCVNPYLDISSLFQNLLFENYIYKTKHVDFADWLFKNNFINEKAYHEITYKGGFASLTKSTSNERLNRFNNTFRKSEKLD